jgi:hypothetical protein
VRQRPGANAVVAHTARTNLFRATAVQARNRPNHRPFYRHLAYFYQVCQQLIRPHDRPERVEQGSAKGSAKFAGTLQFLMYTQ